MAKNKKDIIIWVTISILAIIALTLILTLPQKKVQFEIEDRCGPIANLISHTVQDESVCKTRCKSQCETKDLKYSDISFEESATSCHTCTCFCKEPLFI